MSPSLMAAVLLALLVAGMLPVLYQLYQTLKSARTLLDTAGPQLERTLDQVGQVADRLDRIGSNLEAPAQTLRPVLETAYRVGHSIRRTRGWLRTATMVGGAVAPALIAGVRALFSKRNVYRTGGIHRADPGNPGNGSDT